MKNTLRKIVLGTLIAATAATSIIAPTAASVMASDWVVVELEDETPVNDYEPEYVEVEVEPEEEYVYIEDSDLDCVYVEEPEEEYVYIEIEDEQPAKKSYSQKSYAKSESLDKTHYGETRYANVSDFLALRTRATSDSKMIAKLAPNTKMVIIGTTGDWVKVYVPSVDSDGYVYSKYVSRTMR